MTQVKFFEAQNLTLLEKKVNDFLAHKYFSDILSVKYKPLIIAENHDTRWTAMVTYLK